MGRITSSVNERAFVRPIVPNVRGDRVTERRLEIGIRIALGAARASALRQVMGQGLKLTIVGVIAGLAGALALNQLIASLLFGVQPTDAPTLAAVIATITLVAHLRAGCQRGERRAFGIGM